MNMKSTCQYFVLGLALFSVTAWSALSQNQSNPPSPLGAGDFFETKVRPVLATEC